MANELKQMKTLNGYELVDEQARQRLTVLENNASGGDESLHTYVLEGWMNGTCLVIITTKGEANVFLKSMWNTEQWYHPLPYISSDKEIVNMRIHLLEVNAFGATGDIYCVPLISTATTLLYDESGEPLWDDVILDTGITQFAYIQNPYAEATDMLNELEWVIRDFTTLFESYIYDYDTGSFKSIEEPIPFIEV